MSNAEKPFTDYFTTIQNVSPPILPANVEVMTAVVAWPPGFGGAPPHRHLSGPVFGYVLEGEMRFQLEGEAPQVIKAGEAFWEPGGDVIHYSDANNRRDIPLRFVVTMMCVPGQQMLTLVDREELAERSDERARLAARRVIDEVG
jgi:quercetin dioxygenase-like cupin family protein